MTRSRRPAGRARYRRLSLQSLDDRRVLASITGIVFNDVNDSLRRDDAEPGLGSRIVYLDQNDDGRLNANERYELTSDAGDFTFANVDEGPHAIRVFNGTESQRINTPILAGLDQPILAGDDFSAILPPFWTTIDETPVQLPAVAASGSTLSTVFGGDVELDLPIEIIHLSRLASGGLLVVGNEGNVGRSFLVDADLTGLTELTGDDPAPAWASVAVDDLGRGVLVSSDAQSPQTWIIDASADVLEGVAVQLAAGSGLLGDWTPRVTDGPTRSIVSSSLSVDDGQGGQTDALAISVWSNQTASLINAEPFIVSGATEVVAFNDETGLLVLRQADHLSVHDLENALATLYEVDGDAGVVSIDATRNLLLAMSPSAGAVRLIDANSGVEITELAIDLAALGGVSSLIPDVSLEAVVVLGAAGLAQLNLRRPDAARVQVTGGGDVGPVMIGLRLLGDNAAPQYASLPTIVTLEDNALLRPAPFVWGNASDPNEDEFVSLQRNPAEFGLANIGLGGALSYVPPPNLFGSDQVTVWLHDGRDFSVNVLPIEILAVPDLPTGVMPLPLPIPENVLPGQPIVPIRVLDPDLPGGVGVGQHEMTVDDARFKIINGQLVLVGTPLNYETEPEIYLTVSVADSAFEREEAAEYALFVRVGDEDDPIEAVLPNEASVIENEPGATVATLTIIDEDDEKSYTFEVSDDRFEIVGGVLKLVDGVSLDHEDAATVTVDLTIHSRDLSYTQTIVIGVTDVVETPGEIGLTNESVVELTVAGVVGTVLVDGNPGANGHELTVNDPRFVIEDSTLRLADGVWVSRVDQESITLTITATVRGDSNEKLSQDFVIDVLKNDTPYHNDDLPYDVNGDGVVTARDALAIINYLNTYGPGPVGYGDPGYGFDVNSDGRVSALDALLVINELNRIGSGVGTVGGENQRQPGGEAPPANSTPVVGPPVAPQQDTVPSEFAPRDGALTEVASVEEKYAAAVLATEQTLAQLTGPSSDAERVASADQLLGDAGLDLLGDHL